VWFAWYAHTLCSVTLQYFSVQCRRQSSARIEIPIKTDNCVEAQPFLFAHNSVNAEKRSAPYKDVRRSFHRVHLQNPISRWKHTLRRIIISMSTFPVLVATHRNSKTHQISSTCFTVKGRYGWRVTISNHCKRGCIGTVHALQRKALTA